VFDIHWRRSLDSDIHSAMSIPELVRVNDTVTIHPVSWVNVYFLHKHKYLLYNQSWRSDRQRRTSQVVEKRRVSITVACEFWSRDWRRKISDFNGIFDVSVEDLDDVSFPRLTRSARMNIPVYWSTCILASFLRLPKKGERKLMTSPFSKQAHINNVRRVSRNCSPSALILLIDFPIAVTFLSFDRQKAELIPRRH